MKYCEERNLAEVRAKLAEVRKNVRSALRDMTGEESHDDRLMMKDKLIELPLVELPLIELPLIENFVLDMT